MNISFWQHGEQFRRRVLVESHRRYVVMMDGQEVQVPKYAATPILEEAIKNDNSLTQ